MNTHFNTDSNTHPSIRFSKIAVLLGVAVVPVLLGATAAQSAPRISTPEISTTATDETVTSTAATTDSNPTGSSADLIAQDSLAQEITPGRATRSGPSYVGVGGNIGFGGDTALGEGNFTIYSKVGLTRNFSARPGIVVGDDPTILLPLTADFPIAPVSEDVDFDVAPFVGGGLAISTGSDSLARPLITGGVNVPIVDRVTLTAQGNLAFFRDTEGSVILGVGYNF